MRGHKKREIDLFGIFLGIIVGCLIGFILGGRLNLSSTKDVFGNNANEERGMVYLLQIGRYSDPASAKIVMDKLKTKNLPAVKVEEVLNQKVYYYVYGDISYSNNNVLKNKQLYDNEGFETSIKSKYMYGLSEAFDDDENLKKFWNEAIENLFKSLKNEEISISEQYQINPPNIEVFSYLMTLKGLKNENIKIKYRLELYRVIMESLS